jgi:hypothetical protein
LRSCCRFDKEKPRLYAGPLFRNRLDLAEGTYIEKAGHAGVRCDRRRPAADDFLLVVVAGCGGGGGESKGAVGGTLPRCAQPSTPVDLPSSLASFPLPQGGVIDRTRKDVAGNTIHGGYVPGDVEAIRDWYEEHLPKCGYEVKEGDSEEREAEAEFEGHGVDCEGALSLEVALR